MQARRAARCCRRAHALSLNHRSNQLVSCHLNGALKMDAARAFYEDDVARAKILASHWPAVSASGRNTDATPPAQAAVARCSALPCTATTRSRPASAAARPQAACSTGPMLAHLQHLAGDQDAAARGGTCGQRANHGAQRLRVGVVAVVEDGSAGDLHHLAALVAGSERSERGDGGVEIDACLERDGQAGHGIGRVVLAEQMQSEAAFAVGGAVVHVQSVKVFNGRENLRVSARALRRSRRRGRENRGRTARRTGRQQLRKATPLAGSAATSSNLARAMPAWPSAKFSMCAVPTLVMTPQSGAAMRASAAISPVWFMPISTTANSCSGSRRSSCRGSPKLLLRLP